MTIPVFVGFETINGEARMQEHPALKQSDAETAAGVTPVNPAYPPLHAYRYMTQAQINNCSTHTGTIDVRAALQTAISVAQQTPGGRVNLPGGAYLINRAATATDGRYNGLIVPFTNVFGYSDHTIFEGDGRATTLLAGDNSMTVIRWCDSNGSLIDLAIDGNGKTAVTGLALMGSDMSNAGLVEYVDHNKIRIDIRNCAEALEMQCPGGGQCYYNTFWGGIWQDNTRHIRMLDNATAKGTNRNRFCFTTMIGGNCGLDIDGADTNMFLFCSFEGISAGTSPLGTPTAIRINSVGSLGGASTADNVFIGCHCESNTRDLDCSNRRTHIEGGTIGNQSSGGVFGAVVGSAIPDNMRGGDFTNTLREWLIGNIASDGLYASQRISSYSAQACSQIATSANAAGVFPWNSDGSLVFKARRDASCGAVLRTGATSQNGWNVNADGSFETLGSVVDKATTVQTVTAGSTILVNGSSQAQTSTGVNRAGVILEAGQHDGQRVFVVNLNAGTITFAIDATSHVLNGPSVVIPAYTTRVFCWYAAGSVWVGG